MVSLPQKLPYDLMLTKWAAELNPLLSNLLTQGLFLMNVQLKNGATVINHLLGRKMMGWMIVDQDGSASIYRSAPFNDQTLTLTSNSAVNVRLWVF